MTYIHSTWQRLTLFVWMLFTKKAFSFAIEQTVTVMVITCPYTLGLAMPLVVAVSTDIVFNKNGTLTEGNLSG